MPTEAYVLISGLAAALISLLGARFSGGVQLRIARDNSAKDIQLQEHRLFEKRQRIEAALEREKLEAVHRLLSTVAFETSLTMSYIQNDVKNVDKFRDRHVENCGLLHQALAVTDLYYPDMSDSVREIQSLLDVFWGEQESLMKTKIERNEEGWNRNFSGVLTSGQNIKREVGQLHLQIRRRGRAINGDLAGQPRD